jgi:hypothetical protein
VELLQGTVYPAFTLRPLAWWLSLLWLLLPLPLHTAAAATAVVTAAAAAVRHLPTKPTRASPTLLTSNPAAAPVAAAAAAAAAVAMVSSACINTLERLLILPPGFRCYSRCSAFPTHTSCSLPALLLRLLTAAAADKLGSSSQAAAEDKVLPASTHQQSHSRILNKTHTQPFCQ